MNDATARPASRHGLITGALLSIIAVVVGLLAASPASAAEPQHEWVSSAVAPGGAIVTPLTGQAADRSAATFLVDTSDLSSGMSAYVGVRTRVSGASFYLTQARVAADGAIFVSVKRSVNGVTTDLVPSTRTPLSARGAKPLSIAVRTTGSSSVALSATIGVGGSSHVVSASDASAARLSGGGTAAAWRYNSSRAPKAVSIGLSRGVGSGSPALPAGTSVVRDLGRNTDRAAAEFAVTVPQTGSAYVGTRVRVAGDAFYLLQVRVNSDGRLAGSLKRVVAGRATDIGTPRSLTGRLSGNGSVRVSLNVATSSDGRAVDLDGAVTVSGSSAANRFSHRDTARTALKDTGDAAAWGYAGAGSAGVRVGITPVADNGGEQPSRPEPQPTPSTPSAPSPSVAPVPLPSVTIAPLPPATPATPPVTPPVAPPATDWPSEKNTGVPAGVKLRVHEGDLVVRTPGAVIEGVEVRGFVVIEAPNVVIRNSRIVGRSTSVPAALVTNHQSGQSFTIEDSEIVAAQPSPYANGIMGRNFTAKRMNIHGVIDGIRVTGSNVTIEGSWIHDHLHYTQDPNFGGTPSHDDSIQIEAGSNIRIVGNRTEDAWNASIQVTQGLGTVSALTITRNLMQSGSCTVNVSQKPGGPISGVSITENTFGPERRIRDCAIYGPPTTKMTVRDNVWSDGSTTPITVKWW